MFIKTSDLKTGDGPLTMPKEYCLCGLQVVSILESRARTVDITTQNYYDILYAFYVTRNNFGKGMFMFKLIQSLAVCDLCKVPVNI